jgi:hexosaminidase
MRLALLALLLFSAPVLKAQEDQLSVIPRPLEVKISAGHFLALKKMTVSTDLPSAEWNKLFEYFYNEMKQRFMVQLVETREDNANIQFKTRRMPTGGGLAYELDIDQKGIHIASNFNESAFHALQTLFQLFPQDVKGALELPFVHIYDKPRFAYRGMHLDVGRHFFPVSFIKKYIDYLAWHKMNIFHWHLTEDQGWRIEIRKYPLLTSIGSQRNGTIIGRYPGKGNDEKPYGGFYTQKDIRDVVAYATARFVEVIPEIEMPGHSSAAIAAYPWLSCFPGKPTAIPANMISKKSIAEQKKGRIKLVQETWGVFDDVFCAGNDSTFKFLQDVIDEVTGLFPSKYFHIGGDECPKTHWKICPKCQQLKKEKGLKDEHELQSYFVQRIENYLQTKGKILIGWDEILEGGLAQNAVVMSWRGIEGGIEAAKQRHDVIMTPGNPVYFDHSQSEIEDSVTIGGYNPIEKVYEYEPVPSVLTEEEGKHILGAQANVWTEYMEYPSKVEYMIFPRIEALSEILWSSKENRNWENFVPRLIQAMDRYKDKNINYSKAYFDLKANVLPGDGQSKLKWQLATRFRNAEIRYTTPSNKTPVTYKEPVSIKISGEYQAMLYQGTKLLSTINQHFEINPATGGMIKLAKPASSKYAGDGPFTLVNGIVNTKGTGRSKEFLGFSGDDCEAIIETGSSARITEVKVHTLEQTGSWIWRPAAVEVWGSSEGEIWTALGNSSEFKPVQNTVGNGTLSVRFPAGNYKYIKVITKNKGTIPDNFPGTGNKAWLFVDEIELR